MGRPAKILKPGYKNGDLIVIKYLGIIQGHSKVLAKNITNGLEKVVSVAAFTSGKDKIRSPKELLDISINNANKATLKCRNHPNPKLSKHTWREVMTICDNTNLVFLHPIDNLDDKIFKSKSKVWTFKCFCGSIFYPLLNNIINSGVSSCGCVKIKSQLEIYDFIRRYYPNALSNKKSYFKENRRIQIDIFIPELKLGIEFNGEYWHSKPKAIKNDKIKEELFQKYGYVLFKVYYNDYAKNKDECLSVLLAKIKELENKKGSI